MTAILPVRPFQREAIDAADELLTGAEVNRVAIVMATGKPAANLAGSSKALPESPAASGRAATAIIWPRRDSALLTAEAIPEWRASTLASTVAVMGVISAARPVPNTASVGSTAVK